MKVDFDHLVISVPEHSRAILQRISATKGIPPDKAAAIMVYFACRIMEDGSLQKGADLLTDLDFTKASRLQAFRRADQLQGIAEKVILETQGIQQALRNRTFGS